MPEFKFQLGDIVAIKSALVESVCGRYPKPFQVMEQILQACSGGSQIYYAIRMDGFVKIAEEELVLWSDPAVEGAIGAADEYHDCKEERRAVRWAAGARKTIRESAEKEAER